MILVPVEAVKNTSTAVEEMPEIPYDNESVPEGREKIMTRKMKMSFPLVLVMLSVLIFPIMVTSSVASEINIARLTQEAPYFDSYPGTKGLVWLREVDYSLLSDGRMERISKWVILARRGISDNWLKWDIPIQNVEELEVMEAALYDPGSYSLIAPIIPESRAIQGGLVIREIRFPDIQDEFLIVLVMKEKVSRDCRLDDFLWLGFDIPVWEQKISVNLPAGMDLSYSSSQLSEPLIMDKGATRKYEWHVFDVPSWSGDSLVENNRPSLVFSTRKGEIAFIRDLAMVQKCSLPPVPRSISSLAGSGRSESDLERILEKMENMPILRGIPNGYIRPSIPLEAPWTDAEKILLLSGWLEELGWANRIFWTTMSEIRETTPGSRAFLSEPVLEIETRTGTGVYYSPGQGVPFGEIPPRLWGRTLYALQGDTLEKITIPRGKASDHRLAIRWDLQLGQNGVMSGDMEAVILNGWNDIFFSGLPTDEELVREFLENRIEGDLQGTPEIESLKGGIRVRVKVAMNSTIMNGNNLLVRVPYFFIPQIPEMSKVNSLSSLRFPFAAEQSFEISFPEQMELLALPNTMPRETEGLSLQENFALNKRKNIVKGMIKIVSTIDRVDESTGSFLIDSLRKWVIWADKSLAFIIK